METMNFSKRVVMAAMVAVAAMFGTKAMAQVQANGNLDVTQDMRLESGNYHFKSVKVAKGVTLEVGPKANITVEDLEVKRNANVLNVGQLTVSECFYNKGGEVTNVGTFTVTGDFVNRSILDNYGTLNVSHDLNNGGSFNNYNTLNCGGTVYNYMLMNLGKANYISYNNYFSE